MFLVVGFQFRPPLPAHHIPGRLLSQVSVLVSPSDTTGGRLHVSISAVRCVVSQTFVVWVGAVQQYCSALLLVTHLSNATTCLCAEDVKAPVFNLNS